VRVRLTIVLGVFGVSVGLLAGAALVLFTHMSGLPYKSVTALGDTGAVMTPVNIVAIRYVLARRFARRFGTASPMSFVGMHAAARLMPREAAQEWLAEASSILFEAPPKARRAIARSYLFAAPQVFVEAWAGAVIGRMRAARDTSVSGSGK
jgi:hypothetical protein